VFGSRRPRTVAAGFWVSLVAAAAVSAIPGSVRATTSAAPTPVFTDGFESGSLSQWTASSGVSVQQQVTYAGSWAARATSTGTPTYAYKSLTPLSELYYDGRFDSISQGSTITASLVRFTTSSAGSILSILRRSDGKLAYYNQVTGVTTVGPAVGAAAWHELEVHVLINGASSLIEVWLDGTKISALSKTDSLGTSAVGRVYIGDPASGRTFDYAFDNQVVSTAGDVTPPTTPSGLAAAPLGSSRVNLTWNAAQDNNQVAGYTLYRNGTAFATVGPNTTGYADAGLSASTSYSYKVDAFDGAGNRSAQSAAVSATTGPTTSNDPVIAAAGDIACDPGDSSFNGGAGSATACRELATSNILFSSDLAAVLPLGDDQYEDGTQWKFLQSYDPSWGRLNALAHPVPGNHEYFTQNAAGYFAYFGSLAGDPTKGYYSFDIGAWHIIALNSECSNIGGCGAGSPEEQWLRSDLAAHPAPCTLAYWHRPRFSSGINGSDANYATWWSDLYNAGADVVLNGHDHDYERFAPQNPSHVATSSGIREFVVGTGGAEHTPFNAPSANSQVFNANTFGALKLTLHPAGYDWRFVPGAGGTFTDSGTGACH
jgi:chitodextrinase